MTSIDLSMNINVIERDFFHTWKDYLYPVGTPSERRLGLFF